MALDWRFTCAHCLQLQQQTKDAAVHQARHQQAALAVLTLHTHLELTDETLHIEQDQDTQMDLHRGLLLQNHLHPNPLTGLGPRTIQRVAAVLVYLVTEEDHKLMPFDLVLEKKKKAAAEVRCCLDAALSYHNTYIRQV